ncbi:MAG: 2-dehydropantoate 2-reductase, partial [Anaerolineales bacterium]|nr:2-dehydropantoate 2-reductase [Anaerolineales bacterium]
MQKDSILIVGTGALATLFAARLASVGVKVTLLGSWPEAIEALNEHGAHLTDKNGVERSYPVRAVSDPAACKNARHALVLVKSWQTGNAAQQLDECLHADGIALTLQNGLGNGEILADVLGVQRVAQGVTTTGARLLSAGRARVGGAGKISVETHPRLGIMNAFLAKAGLALESVHDVRSLIWGKLVINTAINPLTALLDVPNGELLVRPSARVLMGELARETAAVARAQNIALAFDDPAAAAEDVARRTSDNISSMLQDLRRGAPTEI